MPGCYLLAISDQPVIVKVTCSDQLDRRLDYWRSHSAQIGWKVDCTQFESRLLEYAVNRTISRPSWRQVKAFTRRHPMFPLNQLSVPQGSREWLCSDMGRARQQVEFLMPLITSVADQIALEDLSEGHRFLRYYESRADGLVDVMGPYKGSFIVSCIELFSHVTSNVAAIKHIVF